MPAHEGSITPPNRRRSLYRPVAGVLLAFALMLLILLFTMDLNGFRPMVERMATQALGMPVEIQGDIGLSLSPELSVTAGDVRIRDDKDQDRYIVIRQSRIGLSLASLLDREIAYQSFHLTDPVISVIRTRDGRFNIESLWAESAVDLFLLRRVSVRNGTLEYFDEAKGSHYRIKGIELDAGGIVIPKDRQQGVLSSISFEAAIRAESIDVRLPKREFRLPGMRSKVRTEKGLFEFRPKSTLLEGVVVTVDLRRPVPAYHVKARYPRVRVEDLMREFTEERLLTGAADLDLDLRFSGRTGPDLRKSLTGEILLRGSDLTFYGADLDRLLSQFEKSQNFSLLDAGALVVAGPVGLGITKGMDFGNVLKTLSGGTSHVRTLVADVNMDKGVATAKDMALATLKYRVAVTGTVDLPGEKYGKVTIAVVNPRGCIMVRQTLNGPFEKPEVESVSMLDALIGPFTNLLENTAGLVLGNDCKVFYEGSVPHPN